MGTRERVVRILAVAAVLLSITVFAACSLDLSDTTLINGQTQGDTSGVAGATPVTLPSACAVTRLAGGIFGDDGAAACAGRSGNTIPVGCTALGTVTPKLADGTDAPPAVHGQNLNLVVTEGGASGTFTQDNSNLFNYTLKRTAAGKIVIKATLTPPGCSAIERTYDLP